jgi:hypothetical protein
VDGGELDDDAACGVLRERGGEAGEVGDVVRDVVADGHVRPRGVGGDVGPGAVDGGGFDRETGGALGEGVEHRGTGVDADHSRRAETEAGRSGADTHIQYDAAHRERISGNFVRGCVLAPPGGLVGGVDEHPRVEEVRRLGRDRDDVVGNRPAGQHLGPPSVGAARLDHSCASCPRPRYVGAVRSLADRLERLRQARP